MPWSPWSTPSASSKKRGSNKKTSNSSTPISRATPDMQLLSPMGTASNNNDVSEGVALESPFRSVASNEDSTPSNNNRVNSNSPFGVSSSPVRPSNNSNVEVGNNINATNSDLEYVDIYQDQSNLVKASSYSLNNPNFSSRGDDSAASLDYQAGTTSSYGMQTSYKRQKSSKHSSAANISPVLTSHTDEDLPSDTVSSGAKTIPSPFPMDIRSTLLAQNTSSNKIVLSDSMNASNSSVLSSSSPVSPTIQTNQATTTTSVSLMMHSPGREKSSTIMIANTFQQDLVVSNPTTHNQQNYVSESETEDESNANVNAIGEKKKKKKKKASSKSSSTNNISLNSSPTKLSPRVNISAISITGTPHCEAWVFSQQQHQPVSYKPTGTGAANNLLTFSGQDSSASNSNSNSNSLADSGASFLRGPGRPSSASSYLSIDDEEDDDQHYAGDEYQNSRGRGDKNKRGNSRSTDSQCSIS